MSSRLAAVAALAFGIVVGASAATAPATLQAVVLSGQPAPGGGTFDRFTVESQPVVAPVNDKGQVAFFATLARAAAAEGIFLASAGRLSKVALQGDPVPGGGALAGFGAHPVPALNARGAVAFAATIAGGRAAEGIFVAGGGRLRAVALAGAAAPGIGGGTLTTLDAPALNDRGEVAFLAGVRRGRDMLESIYVRSGNGLRKVVASGDAVPGGGTFVAFGPPALDNRGRIAFAAIVERGVAGGLFLAAADGIRKIAGAGEDSPLGGFFLRFSERVMLNDAGVVAFHAVLKDAPVRSAIMVAADGGLRVVAALGDPAPGGGRFSHFGLWPALARAEVVAFVASVDGGPAPVAVVVAHKTEATKAAGAGDAVGGGTIGSFGLFPVVAISPGGTVTFATAGTESAPAGIFRVGPSPR
jgi:hypothetical protein